ncbi:MAG: hypothetical protein ACI89L_002635 [Phycisphaerales bacterium]|jgi:hypothetical protein
MPVVQIDALPQPAAVSITEVMQKVRDAVASGLDCEPGSVWVTWRTLDAYLCHDTTPDTQPHQQSPTADEPSTHDPILRVMAASGREPQMIAGTLTGASIVLAGALGLSPGHVFAVYEELKPGRAYTGGAVLG